MERSCEQSGAAFEVSEREQEFRRRASPLAGGDVLEIGAPAFSPAARRRQRLAFRNDRNLYLRSGASSKQRLISVYSPDKPQPVLSQDEWWSDRWDAYAFGRSYDFGRLFFDQFQELRLTVPAKGLSNLQCENCDFNNNLQRCKNCYLCFGCHETQDSFYVTDSYRCRDCVDVWWSREIEMGIGIYNSKGLYGCFSCQDCSDSHDLLFCRNCYSCEQCFGCFSLSRKKHCIFNLQYDQEEYLRHIGLLRRGSYSQIKKLAGEVRDFFLSQPQRAVKTSFVENCRGDMIYRSKDCLECFTLADSEDCMHLYECGRNKGCCDMDYSYDCTGLVLEALGCESCFHCAFLVDCQRCSDSYYLAECYSARNCFGCVGLRSAEYCILNRQYSRDEYQKLLPRIVDNMQKTGEWGRFFPFGLSPFGYNETDAALFYPASKEEVLQLGGRWSAYEKPEAVAPQIIPAEGLPDDIQDVGDDILEAAIACEAGGKLFRLSRAELGFYRRHSVPVPRRHPDQRHRDMLSLRNPPQLWKRACQRCGKEVESTYAPERSEIIHCEECHIGEVY
jgi:hypothetical protein